MYVEVARSENDLALPLRDSFSLQFGTSLMSLFIAPQDISPGFLKWDWKGRSPQFIVTSCGYTGCVSFQSFFTKKRPLPFVRCFKNSNCNEFFHFISQDFCFSRILASFPETYFFAEPIFYFVQLMMYWSAQIEMKSWANTGAVQSRAFAHSQC